MPRELLRTNLRRCFQWGPVSRKIKSAEATQARGRALPAVSAQRNNRECSSGPRENEGFSFHKVSDEHSAGWPARGRDRTEERVRRPRREEVRRLPEDPRSQRLAHRTLGPTPWHAAMNVLMETLPKAVCIEILPNAVHLAAFP